MLRLSRSLVLLAFLTAAVLSPGTAVFAQAPAENACLPIRPDNLWTDLVPVRMIVIGTVALDDGGMRIEPQAYLKGAASNEPVRPRKPATTPSCPLAEFTQGSRVIAFLTATGGVLDWPGQAQVFTLSGGNAVSGGPAPLRTTEAQLVEKVRTVTGQYAVPAATTSETAGIDWLGTVVPLGAALLVVFVIGILLMRIWHRIDPS